MSKYHTIRINNGGKSESLTSIQKRFSEGDHSNSPQVVAGLINIIAKLSGHNPKVTLGCQVEVHSVEELKLVCDYIDQHPQGASNWNSTEIMEFYDEDFEDIRVYLPSDSMAHNGIDYAWDAITDNSYPHLPIVDIKELNKNLATLE